MILVLAKLTEQQQQNQIWIPLLVGLLVTIVGGGVPVTYKYLNKKFGEITMTASRVDRHHKANKKKMKKLRDQQKKMRKDIRTNYALEPGRRVTHTERITEAVQVQHKIPE